MTRAPRHIKQRPVVQPVQPRQILVKRFNDEVERLLSTLLNEMKSKGTFDEVTVLKPYSFVLVDEDKETIAELLLMDDDTLLLNEELLKGLDEELDAFLKDLLEK